MCLALPAEVLETDGIFCRVRIGKTERTVINPIAAKQREFVLIQQGTIVEKIEHRQANDMALALAKPGRKKKKTN